MVALINRMECKDHASEFPRILLIQCINLGVCDREIDRMSRTLRFGSSFLYVKNKHFTKDPSSLVLWLHPMVISHSNGPMFIWRHTRVLNRWHRIVNAAVNGFVVDLFSSHNNSSRTLSQCFHCVVDTNHDDYITIRITSGRRLK
eukprot:951188_1